jgi:type IV secretion system protein VirD4
MKGLKKDSNGFIAEPGHMVVYVAGYPAIHGVQPLYFKDPELLRRAQIPADSAQRTEVRIA